MQLNYMVSTGSVTEQILLANDGAPRDFHFFLADPDGVLGTLTRTDDGGYSFSGNGDLIAAIPPAVAWEVNADGDRLPNPPSGLQQSAHLEIVPADAGFAVHTWVDADWLVGKQFPIVLDPPMTWGYGRPGLTSVGAGPTLAKNVGINNTWSTSCPSVPSQTCLPMFDFSFLYAGSVNSSGNNVSAIRSVFSWDYPDGAQHHAYDTPNSAPFNLPERAKILDAQLWLDQAACIAGTASPGADCGPAAGSKSLTVHRLTTKANPSWTWAQVAGAMASSTSNTSDPSMRTYQPPYKNDWTGLNAQIYSPGNWQALQIGDVVQGWVNNPAAGAGLVIKAADESVGNHGTFWLSNSVPTVGQRPFLSVHWDYETPGKSSVTTSVSGSTVKVDWSVPTGTWPDNYYLVLKEHNTGLPVASCTYKMLPGTPGPTEHVCTAPPTGSQLPPTDFTFTNIPNGDYDAVVYSSNGSGVLSPASDTVGAHVGTSPLAPLFQATNVQASVNGTSHTAHLAWTRATATSLLGILSGQHVRAYNASTGAALSGDQVVPTTQTSLDYDGLPNGTSVYFTVTSQLGGNDIPNSALLPTMSSDSNAVMPYGAPRAASITSIIRGDRAVTVNWLPPQAANGDTFDNGRPLDKFKVDVYLKCDRSTNSQCSDTLATTRELTSPPNLTSQTALSLVIDESVTGKLANGTAYYARVAAHNLAGYGPASPASDEIIPAGRPSTPGHVHAIAGDREAMVTWSPSDGNGSAVGGYTVYRWPGGASREVTSPATEVTFDQLDNGHRYQFTVYAHNDVGVSDESDVSETVVPVGVPTTPTNVQAQAWDGSAYVSWNPVYPNNDGAENGVTYTVIAIPGGAVTPVTTSDTTILVEGLTNGQQYSFAVKAATSAGESGYSAPSNSVVPQPLSEPQPQEGCSPSGLPDPPADVLLPNGARERRIDVPCMPLHGVVRMGWFIKDSDVRALPGFGIVGAGDGRDFDRDMTAEMNRIYAEIDFNTGRGRLYVNYSCEDHTHDDCTAARPLEDRVESKVLKNGGVQFNFAIGNSLQADTPGLQELKISANITVMPTSLNEVRVTGSTSIFPSFEMYHDVNSSLGPRVLQQTTQSKFGVATLGFPDERLYPQACESTLPPGVAPGPIV